MDPYLGPLDVTWTLPRFRPTRGQQPSSRCGERGQRAVTSRPLMTIQVFVAPPQRLGAVPHGTRVIAPNTSGSFEARACAERSYRAEVTGLSCGLTAFLSWTCGFR